MAALRLALAGGGTGGHVVPGLHLVAHLAARSELADLLWFVTGRRAEERALAAAGALPEGLSVERVRLDLEPPGGGAPGPLRLLARTLPDGARARSALRRHGSQVLLGLGGYTSLPAVLAARSLRIPVALLEVNAVAGRATRWLAPAARRVFHAWPGSVPAAGGARRERHVHTGPPLGPGLAPAEPTEPESADALRELGLDPEAPLLLVLGGSQGAGSLNGFLRAHAAELLAAGLQVLHQVGPGRLDEAAPGAERYRAAEYLDDVPLALAAATLVLCRGGAATLAEVAARRRPAVVVPYPHHPDRHQERNARQLGEGVRIVAEGELGPPLARELARLAGEPGHADRAAMAAALAQALAGEGSARIASELQALAAGRAG